jgi:hypothetical protein
MQNAIEARYPHLIDMFYYINGDIVAINKNFKFKDYDSHILKNSILNTAYSEMKNIKRFTDFDKFIYHIRNALFI